MWKLRRRRQQSRWSACNILRPVGFLRTCLLTLETDCHSQINRLRPNPDTENAQQKHSSLWRTVNGHECITAAVKPEENWGDGTSTSFRLASGTDRAIDLGWNAPKERASLLQPRVLGVVEFLVCSQ